jgi:hypothetical protein
LKREGIAGSVNWVELKGKEALPEDSQPPQEYIDVFIGTCTVRVKQGFDRVLFADICKMLSEQC